MQKHSTLPCFAPYGEQTAHHLRDRFQPTLTHSLIGEYVDRLIDTSLGSNWTRLYDSVRFFFEGKSDGLLTGTASINIIRNPSCSLPTFFFFFIPHDVKACEKNFI